MATEPAPIGWQRAATATEARRLRREASEVWMAATGPCPTCWEQRGILHDGVLGLVLVICETCDGRGRVLV